MKTRIAVMILGFVALFFLLVGCTDPFGAAAGKASLTVSAGPGNARTLVPDFAASITSYDITLTSHDGYASRNVTGVDSSHTFTDIEIGTWDVTVKGMKGSTEIASGTSAGQVLTLGASVVINVTLSPASTGTGSFSLDLRLPASTGINKITWSLLAADGSLVAGLGATDADLSLGAADYTFNVAGSAIASGTYSLVLEFKQGTEAAGTFVESVNIWDNMSSNKWIMPDGSLAAERVFGTAEFFDGNCEISQFSVTGSRLGTVTIPPSASVSPYSLGPVLDDAIDFTATDSGIAGQSLSYSFNGSGYLAIASGAGSASLALQAGVNTLAVRLMAANGVTSKTWTVTMTAVQPYQSASLSGLELIKVPGGTFRRSASGSDLATVGSFLMGRTEITRAQYTALLGATDPSDTSVSPTADCPVQQVSWYQTLVFCNKLSLLEGLEPVYSLNGTTNTDRWPSQGTAYSNVVANHNANGYRLPTSDEWQWAAMAGMGDSVTANISGGINIGGFAKFFPGYDGNPSPDPLNHAVCAENTSGTSSPVGSKLPNELGLYDLYGNVSEYLWNFSVPTTPVTNYNGGTGNTTRYFTGYNWADPVATFSYLADCLILQEYLTGSNKIGFRVVRSITHGVRYMAGNASSGLPPVNNAHYFEGNPVVVDTNSSNALRGALIQDGITQRLIGWSKTAGATSADFATGANAPMETSDLVLYPVWSSTTPSSSPGSMVSMVGPAGGWVIIDNGSVSSDGWRYMEAANGGELGVPPTIIPAIPFSNITSVSCGTTGTAVGTGRANTLAFLSQSGYTGGSAKYCRDYWQTYQDYFLPSVYEMTAVNSVYRNLGIYLNWDFQVSSEDSSSTIYNVWLPFTTANTYSLYTLRAKTECKQIKPVRAFRDINPTYMLRYDVNGATSGLAPVDGYCYEAGESATVRANTGSLAKSGKVFLGWSPSPDSTTIYLPGDALRITGDTTLYARYQVSLISENFNSLTPSSDGTSADLMQNQGLWTVANYKGGLLRLDSSPPAPHANSQCLHQSESGSGTGSTVWYPLDLSSFDFTSSTSMIRLNYKATPLAWGLYAGFDLGNDPGLNFAQSMNGDRMLVVADGIPITPTPVFNPNSGAWEEVEILVCNQKVTVHIRLEGTASWTTLVQDLPLKSNLSASDKSNPALWNYFFMHMEGADGWFDDLSVSLVY